VDRLLDQLDTTRALMVRLADGMDQESLVTVPSGFTNHVLWNLGHVAVTTALLTYGLAGLSTGFEDQAVMDFRKGSKPGDWRRDYDWSEVRGWLVGQTQRLESDLDGGHFTTFKSYHTSAGVHLDSVEDAIAFNTFHEGIHLGYILAQRKALGC